MPDIINWVSLRRSKHTILQPLDLLIRIPKRCGEDYSRRVATRDLYAHPKKTVSS